MYMPLLRSRQNELLALSEMLDEGTLSNKIIPLIEPVNTSPTLRNSLLKFNDSERQIYLVTNSTLSNKKNLDFFIENNNLNNDFNQAKYFEDNEYDKEAIQSLLIFKTLPMNLSSLNFPSHKLLINLDDKRIERRINEFVNSNALGVIGLKSSFEKQSRNQDYAINNDEFFSEEHLFYKDSNLIGFSDYSIVPKEFNDAGFAPKAVAIHLVYFDPKDKTLRIHHFVSKTNDSINNPAGKFKEALDELVNWYNSKDDIFKKFNKSNAISELKKIHEDRTYPGLGKVKRICIKHHLEIMGRYLDGKQS